MYSFLAIRYFITLYDLDRAKYYETKYGIKVVFSELKYNYLFLAIKLSDDVEEQCIA